jgi:hypothetical protein
MSMNDVGPRGWPVASDPDCEPERVGQRASRAPRIQPCYRHEANDSLPERHVDPLPELAAPLGVDPDDREAVTLRRMRDEVANHQVDPSTDMRGRVDLVHDQVVCY